jgi:hypothetical protein
MSSLFLAFAVVHGSVELGQYLHSSTGLKLTFWVQVTARKVKYFFLPSGERRVM